MAPSVGFGGGGHMVAGHYPACRFRIAWRGDKEKATLRGGR